MEKQIDNILFTSNYGRVKFEMDGKEIYSGIPFQDVEEYKDIIIEENKVILKSLVSSIVENTDKQKITKLIEVDKEFDVSNLNIKQEEESEEESEESEEE